MCAIVGSFDKEKLAKLIDLNSYRGNHSYSLLEYNWKEKKIVQLTQGFGSFKYELITSDRTENSYFIAHTQAPTTSGKGFFNIHPSHHQKSLLYHNGILKEDCIFWLQDKYHIDEKWDTRLLHKYINDGHDLSEIDGTFSCLNYRQGNWYLFRNEISPMFIDRDFNISSTRFDNSTSTPPNQELLIDFKNKNLELINTFSTKENPYFFG